jgi:broad specificity phosphatase PhoE
VNTKATNFILVRHQLVDNPQGIFYGVSYNFGISKEGKAKARQLGFILKEAGVDLGALYESDLFRTQETGVNILQGMGVQESEASIKIDPRLTDVAFPKLEGRKIEDGYITLEDGEKVSLDALDKYATESLQEAGQRSLGALLDMVQNHPGETVIVISHGDTIAGVEEEIRRRSLQIEGEFPTQLELVVANRYPAKGDYALFSMNLDGMLTSNILRNPNVQEMRVFLEGNQQRRKEQEPW